MFFKTLIIFLFFKKLNWNECLRISSSLGLPAEGFNNGFESKFLNLYRLLQSDDENEKAADDRLITEERSKDDDVHLRGITLDEILKVIEKEKKMSSRMNNAAKRHRLDIPSFPANKFYYKTSSNSNRHPTNLESIRLFSNLEDDDDDDQDFTTDKTLQDLLLTDKSYSSNSRGRRKLQTDLISKRDYSSLQCSGLYDQSKVTQLERICNDCYELYKNPEVHGYCRSKCFGSEVFRQCLQSLLLNSKADEYLNMVEVIG